MAKITDTHADYKANQDRWEFYLRSYLGGNDYQDGFYLTRYINEDKDAYNRRISLTPIDNHCRPIVHIYSSFLWRVPPVRVLNSLEGNPAVSEIMKDADLDGMSFDAFMRQAQQWASVYGHVWLMADMPRSNARTRAEELEQGLRPYVNLYTPENVFDWKYERSASGRYVLTYLKTRESIHRKSETEVEATFRIWTPETVEVWMVENDKETKLDEMPNPLGRIPAVFLPAARTNIRGVGSSDIADVAYMQKAIYEELSEIEQLIRITNHPTLVKTHSTDAHAGAGAIINMDDDLDGGLKPYQLQPDGSNLDAVRAAIADKVESINRMAHMGAVRGTKELTQSGVAMQTEFQMLSAKLSEKADILELAEEQLWGFICQLLGVTPDVEIYYADSFDLRDYPAELQLLQGIKASGVRSPTLQREVDKKIADLVLDDEDLARAYNEIDAAGTTVLGQFGE